MYGLIFFQHGIWERYGNVTSTYHAPDLNLNVEESWLGALTIIEQIITQGTERVGEKSPGHKLVHTSETDSGDRIQAITPNPRYVPHHMT